MMIWRCLVAISLAVLTSTSVVDAAPAASYTYDLIFQQAGFPVGPPRFAINSGGDVAYQVDGGTIFRSNGTTTVAIGAGALGGINAAGEVVFITGGGTQVAKSDGTTITIIATVTGPVVSADINDSGTVVFSTPSGVFTWNGGPVTTVVSQGDLDANGRVLDDFDAASITANGDIVFRAATDDGDGIFFADGLGAPVVLVDTRFDANQPHDTQYGGFGDPAISAGGNVAMWAESYAFTNGVLFIPAGGTPAWHFYDADGFFGVLDSVSPNDHGRIVMELAQSPNRLLAVTDGPGLDANGNPSNVLFERILGEDDTLFGQRVATVDLGNGSQRRINDTGDFVFYVQLDNGGAFSQAVVRAKRVLPEVSVQATDAAASEAGPDTGTFTFTRTGDLSAPLTVFFSTSGTATASDDFTLSATGSVTIPADAGQVQVTVTPAVDGATEGDETVIVTVTPAATYRVGTPASATMTIADQGGLPTVSVQTLGNASETGPGAGSFRITRSAADVSAPLLVTYQLSGNAVVSADFTVANATGATIPAGASSVDVAIVPQADAEVEGNESVVLQLIAAATYSIGTPAQATVLIADDPQVVTIEATDPAAAELGPDPGAFTIRRAGGSHAASLTVAIVVSGSASPGLDYQTINSPIVIPAGQSSVVVQVLPILDQLVEGAESVIVTLTGGSGYVVGVANSATVTIAGEASVVTLTATVPVADELGPVNGELRFERSGDVSSPLTVEFQFRGLTCFGNRCPVLYDVDYRLPGAIVTNFLGNPTRVLTGRVTFGAAQSIVTLPVAVLPDGLIEGDEAVQFILRTMAGYVVGSSSVATVTIRDAHPVGRAIADLRRQVVDHPSLEPNAKESLTTRLDRALDALAAGRTTAARDELTTFIQRVERLYQNLLLDAATAASWIDQARSIRSAI